MLGEGEQTMGARCKIYKTGPLLGLHAASCGSVFTKTA